MTRNIGTAVLTLLVACFPFGGPARSLPGAYELEQSEGGDIFWINGPGSETAGGGVLEGSVEQIGWNDKYIIAYRHATFRGDPDGWMVIDVVAATVSGPMNEAAWKARPELQNIQPTAVAEAWKRL